MPEERPEYAKSTGSGPGKRPGAAALCRSFMENEGWLQLFRIARGESHRCWIKTQFGTKEATITPDFDTRLTAYRHICSYGYGRPAELARADDSGQSVTDALIASIRSQGASGEVAQ